MALPELDQYLEDIFTMAHKAPESDSTDAARIAKLAFEYRLNQKKQQRLRRAAERLAEERRQLRQQPADGTPSNNAG